MSGRIVVVDDHLLLRVLLDDEPAGLRPRGARLVTTGLWYHRLCRAVSNPRVAGALSRRLSGAGPSIGAAVVRAVTGLPETVGLVSLRELAWPMARLLDDGIRLNLLSLEALAAAEQLDAELCLASIDQNPRLLAAAGARGTPIRLVDH
ncbi:MAG: hypothetical protein IVW52_13525 [Acidimicrobiales bacterium]|nr:hypothetical protein [Acidimicrobiales bacterium]